MKRILTMLLSVTIAVLTCFPVMANDAVAPYTVEDVSGNFAIDPQGVAHMQFYCLGDSTTESIRVTVKLEKRTLLLFWKDVET